jgi:ParB-like chromosome segregation protein Spo0J
MSIRVKKMSMKVEKVPIDKLTISKWNPRFASVPKEEKLREFASNIQKISLLSPIVTNKKYEILSGGLRWRALKLAGVKETEVLVYDTEELARQKNLPLEVVEAKISISSDLYKFPLHTSEKGAILDKLRSQGYSLKDVASIIGCTEDTVWRWWQSAEIPSTLKKGLEPKYKKLSTKKKLKVRQILESIPEEYQAQVLNLAEKVTLRDLEMAAKDIISGAPVDFDWRVKYSKEDTELVQYRILDTIIIQFRELCKVYDKDPYKMFVEAVKFFTAEENFKKLVGPVEA